MSTDKLESIALAALIILAIALCTTASYSEHRKLTEWYAARTLGIQDAGIEAKIRASRQSKNRPTNGSNETPKQQPAQTR